MSFNEHTSENGSCAPANATGQSQWPTSEPAERIYNLFNAALELTAEERPQFLERGCGDDRSLRLEVEQLLREDAQAAEEGFLDPQTAGFLHATPAAEPEKALIGKRIGAYEIQGWIASGGMGRVYRAVRVDGYKQRVALKVLSHPLLDGSPLARFSTERQVMADLNHANIARLLDGGTTCDGLPYLVMEYVDGVSIDQYCDTRQLTIPERVRLVGEVCGAVHFAHEHGIVHRDLKPANVLVTHDGVPKLTDFGLAKQMDFDSGQTHTGQVLGTPSYMAPEQAGGDMRQVGAGTDVYALGAILYELLTGRPPFKGATWRQTLDQVCQEEPVPPRRLQPALPRDLETICLKCLQKNPAKRYGTALAVRQDLERFLAGEPIQARPVGWAERFFRWCQRNPRVAALGMALVLILLTSFITVTVLWQLAVRRQLAFQEKEQEASAQRGRAEEKEQLARRAVDDMYTWVAARLLDSEPRMTLKQREFLEKALAFYQQFAQENGTDPEVRYKTSQAYYYVAGIQARLGRLMEARHAYGQQIDLLEPLVEEFPDRRDYRYDLFYSRMCLASCQASLGQLSEAEKGHRLALAQIERLAADFPQEPNYRDALASERLNLGHLLGDTPAAEKLFRQALTMAEQLVSQYPDKRTPPQYGHNVSLAYQALGILHRQRRQAPAAEEFFRNAIRVARQLSAQNPEVSTYRQELTGHQAHLAYLLTATGRLAEAETILVEAVAREKLIVADFPDLVWYRRTLAQMCRDLGYLYHATGKPNAAHQAFGDYFEAQTWLNAQLHDPDQQLEMAWLLCACPEEKLRDPRRALQMVNQPHLVEDKRIQQVTGLAHYRLENWQQAKAELAKCSAEPMTTYLLATTCQQLGERAQARRYYEQAEEKRAKESWRDLPLESIQGEAARVLGIEVAH